MENRIHNFNAGPAALPLPVLEEIRENFLNFQDTGMSIIEMSHRSNVFDGVLDDAIDRLKRLLRLTDEFHVLFIQGGASLQFAMVPMNLAVPGRPLNYINTGSWSKKAIEEAQIQRKDVQVIATSEDKKFSYIPTNYVVDKSASYLHFTSNNTIVGTQWRELPSAGDIPLVSDMSSDFLSRPVDIKPFGAIYAGAQKNLGPAGAAVVIIREDMLKRVPSDLPNMLRYTTYSESKSLYNTPPTFTIYVIGLVLKWLEETVGGLEKIEKINTEKAVLLYEAIDRSEIFQNNIAVESRSSMNVTFSLATKELEKQFLAQAAENGFSGLKGHRSVGGCRASIYNAVSLDSVRSLIQFMHEFEQKSV